MGSMSAEGHDERFDLVTRRLNEGDARMDRIEQGQRDMVSKLDQLIQAVGENTEITNTVKDALTTARVGRKVLVWVGGIGSGIAGIWAAVQAVLHGGIGPK